MGLNLTPAEVFMLALLGLGALMLALLVLLYVSRLTRRKVRQWRESRRRKPDVLADLQTRNSHLKAEHAMMAHRLERTMQEAEERITRYRAEAARADNRAGILAERLDKANERIAGLENTIAGLKRTIAELRKELAETQTRAEKLFAERSDLNLQLASLQEKHDALAARERTRASELADAAKALKQARAEAKDLAARLREAEAARKTQAGRIEELERQLQERDAAHARLETELADERAHFLREKMRLQEQIATFSERLEKAKSGITGPAPTKMADEKRQTASAN